MFRRRGRFAGLARQAAGVASGASSGVTTGVASSLASRAIAGKVAGFSLPGRSLPLGMTRPQTIVCTPHYKVAQVSQALLRPAVAGLGSSGANSTTPQATTAAPTGYTPTQLRNAYGVSQLSLTGAGQTVLVIDAYKYSGNLLTDFATFDAYFGIGYPDVLTVDSSLATTANASWSLEMALDVQAIHLMAPQAKIVMVQAASATDAALFAAIKYGVAKYKPCAVTMSWGGSETSTQTSYDTYFQVANTVFVASAGDSTGVIYPSSSAYVLSIGGTTLTLSSTGVRESEVAWSSSGGGPSAYIAMPSYQSNAGLATQSNITKPTKRQTPDMSLIADPDTGGVAVYGYYNGKSQWVQVGGTSASCALWGGLIALLSQQLASSSSPLTSTNALQTYLYSQCLPNDGKYLDVYDIVTGASGSNKAQVGYDLVTGIGTAQCAPLTETSTPVQSTPTILTGTTTPATTLGVAGNYYVDTATGAYYTKSSSTTWTLLGNILPATTAPTPITVSVQGLIADAATGLA